MSIEKIEQTRTIKDIEITISISKFTRPIKLIDSFLTETLDYIEHCLREREQ